MHCIAGRLQLLAPCRRPCHLPSIPIPLSAAVAPRQPQTMVDRRTAVKWSHCVQGVDIATVMAWPVAPCLSLSLPGTVHRCGQEAQRTLLGNLRGPELERSARGAPGSPARVAGHGWVPGGAAGRPRASQSALVPDPLHWPTLGTAEGPTVIPRAAANRKGRWGLPGLPGEGRRSLQVTQPSGHPAQVGPPHLGLSVACHLGEVFIVRQFFA